MDLMSEYFKDYKGEPTGRKTISVDQEFVDTLYDQDIEFSEDCSPSPPSLKKMAAAAVHNDSGYEGLDSNKKSHVTAQARLSTILF